MNPGSQEQLKFPAGRLMQRPWGPHTLDEMCHTLFWVLLVATATVQLSITLGYKSAKTKTISHLLAAAFKDFPEIFDPGILQVLCYLDTGWSCSGPSALNRSCLRSRLGSCSRNLPSGCGTGPCCDTGSGCMGCSAPTDGKQ